MSRIEPVRCLAPDMLRVTAAVILLVGVLTWKLAVCDGMASNIDDVVKVLAERLQVCYVYDFCNHKKLHLYGIKNKKKKTPVHVYVDIALSTRRTTWTSTWCIQLPVSALMSGTERYEHTYKRRQGKESALAPPSHPRI